MGLFNLLKKKRVAVEEEPIDEVLKQLDSQIHQRTEERNKVNFSSDLTPSVHLGKKRKYHYKDVNIWVNWQHSGHYGKSCKSIGMRRGDAVDLIPHSTSDDAECVAVLWNGIEIGFMKTNRMRGMVHQWKAAGLPVLAVVSQVGGIEKLFLEIAFYGFLPKNK